MTDLEKKADEINSKIKNLQDEFRTNNEFIEKMSISVNKLQADIRTTSDKNHLIHGAVQAYMDTMKLLQPEGSVDG